MSRPFILVTGATDGIGRQTALELAQRGAHVLVHGRTHVRAEAACAHIRTHVPEASVEPVAGDFSSLTEVRALADAVSAAVPSLDVLINNAGVYMNERVMTADGHEATLGINHLAPFVLTLALEDLLRRSAPARIVNVSSVAHTRGRIDLDDLQSARRYDAYAAYAASKLANVLFTYEHARRLEGSCVTANCLHPGVITTKLLATGFNTTGADLASGAATSVHLATSPDVAQITGRYFARSRETESSPTSHDRTLQARLWEESLRLTAR